MTRKSLNKVSESQVKSLTIKEQQRSKPNFSVFSKIFGRIGSVLGVSSFVTSANYAQKTCTGSVNRVISLWSAISDKSEKIFDHEKSVTISDLDQFAAAMKVYQVNDTELGMMVINTRQNFVLYVIILICSTILGIFSLISYPPDHLFYGVIRFLPIPFLCSLIFKHAYSNWIFRNQILGTPLTFLRAGDRWPRLK